MASMNERTNFFGFQDDKLIYDERKKRFVHTADMPAMLSRQYQSSQFKTVSLLQTNSLKNSKDQISMVTRLLNLSGNSDLDNN